MKSRTCRVLAPAVLLLAGAPGLAAALAPIAILGDATAPKWKGPQFVQADRAGRVYFLRADTLEVFPLDKAGRLAKPARLEQTALERGHVLRAVLSPAGDQWLVYGDFMVRRFVNGKEKSLPELEWNPWGVGFVRDVPVVAVIPRRLDRHETDPAALAKAPWLLGLSGDRWSPLRETPEADLSRALASGGLNQAIAENAVLLQGDKEGKLWVARQYSYRVQRFSATGRPLLEITVNRGDVSKKQEKTGIEVKLHRTGENPTDATHSAKSERGRYFPFTAKPVILGLASGPDGRFYFLVQQEDGSATLDRYDPVLVALQRLKLDFKPPSVLSMASGKDAIYLAANDGQGGRWRIPWESLEGVTWRAVKGAEIDGVEPATEGRSGPAPKATPK